MADNRMYLKCNLCGKCTMLAKRFGITWGTREYEYPMAIKIDKFFDKHELCLDSEENWEIDHYSLVYENDEEDIDIETFKEE